MDNSRTSRARVEGTGGRHDLGSFGLSRASPSKAPDTVTTDCFARVRASLFSQIALSISASWHGPAPLYLIPA